MIPFHGMLSKQSSSANRLDEKTAWESGGSSLCILFVASTRTRRIQRLFCSNSDGRLPRRQAELPWTWSVFTPTGHTNASRVSKETKRSM